MAYGQSERIATLNTALTEAVDMLVGVATGEKSVEDIRTWLEEKYPDDTMDTTTKKKW